ncbi:hypothetical protein J2X24_004040 [Asticcacaulis solisilvae]|nr:hypothetical protein [Asticcacaulis solisilvae]MDR6802501.1 hypothetical protein [Asticcacaulis sp. BE141]
MAYLILQYAVLAVAVVFSLWHLLGKISPKTLQVLRTRLTGRAPEQAPRSCGTGCDTCGACASIAALTKDIRPR